MPKQPPRKPPVDSFASFGVDALRSSGRRRKQWSLNPLRDERMASAEGGRLAGLEGRLREAIRRRDRDGETLEEIGRSYNVSHSTISRLKA